MKQPTISVPLLERLRRLARAHHAERPVTVALPEATDPRVLRAAVLAAESGLARPLLVGSVAGVRAALRAAARAEAERSDLDRARLELLSTGTESLEIFDPEQDEDLEADIAAVRAELIARGVTRGVEDEEVRTLLRSPLGFANLLVRRGAADGAVMGAVATTAETLRAALRVVGVDPRFGVVTSCFLMAFEDRTLVYADCGVVPSPDAVQLAAIAQQAAGAYRRLVGEEPRVALLAFATHGSAEHPSLEPVRGAVAELRRRGVDFPFDGELQADAALVPAVATSKAPGSEVAGRANVLVFPDLNSGNIAYKLTERLAGARAIGPLLQGLGRPIHDLSRGCSTDDVLDAIAITVLDAAAGQGDADSDRFRSEPSVTASQ